MIKLNNDPVKVLIADDHPIFRDGFKILLNKLEPGSVHLSGEAGDGKELVERVFNLQPHIVITDIQMPVMDGIEATKRIKALSPQTEVIALSMFNEEHLVLDMLEAGASGYLLKNTSKTELEQAIRTVMDGGVYFAPETSVHLAKTIKQSAEKQNAGKQIVRIENRSRKPKLSERELEIIYLLCKGKTNKEIASELYLSPRTIESHREHLYEKTATKSAVALAIYAIKHGIVDLSHI